MSVAVGFVYDKGLLLCTDTKITTDIKTNESKMEYFVSDDGLCSMSFAMVGQDLNFPRMAIQRCWNAVKGMDFSVVSIDAVHDAAEFSLAEFYRDHIYPHPDREPNRVFLELLVGIWLRGNTNLYVSHETVLSRVDQYESIGSGAYLAKYLIEQYIKANSHVFTTPVLTSLRDVGMIAEFAVQSAINFVETCGGDPDLLIIKNDGGIDDICPSNLFPDMRFIENMQKHLWRLLHDLAHIQDDYEGAADRLTQAHCTAIKAALDMCKSDFDNLRRTAERHRWD